MTEIRQLKLPENLCAAAEQKFGSRFRNLEELLTFVLQDLLEDSAARLDEVEQRIVEGRLRELGYI